MYTIFSTSERKIRDGYFIFRVFSKKDFDSMLTLIQHYKPECLNLANEKSKVKRSKEGMYLLVYYLLKN